MNYNSIHLYVLGKARPVARPGEVWEISRTAQN
jgi:hypothetical protein